MIGAALALASPAAQAATVETNLCIVNFQDVDKTPVVAGITNSDWVPGDRYRPDKNFDNVVVGPYHTVCQRVDVSSAATSPKFKFVINGEETEMQFDQRVKTWSSLAAYSTQTIARYRNMIWSQGAKAPENKAQLGIPCTTGIHCYGFSIGP
jgi:hypothetical protein